ncbi:DNA-binding protein [Robbsia sp. Bb-Pol-6]|uniref:DNA-binding protein n=1 Tax=Robbsia betulipollinis TaxID=2981849 RepID=A0ABT3ZKS7_9BURK|nr:PPC domain-containing DNA-binding protein [Robbsia betulipollinis]MCY0386553.1 DNA-binding protein [Robbsia betulipollinis]
MQTCPLRLLPGDDLRGALEAMARVRGWRAAFVIQGIGSLSVAQLRFAGVDAPATLRGDLEILTLAGSLAPDGAHLHMSVADARGQVSGGHVSPGCAVRTTAELVVLVLPEYAFSRERDARTGFPELMIRAAVAKRSDDPCSG